MGEEWRDCQVRTPMEPVSCVRCGEVLMLVTISFPDGSSETRLYEWNGVQETVGGVPGVSFEVHTPVRCRRACEEGGG